MVKISRDTPCYYLTSVTKDRLPIFQTDKVKKIVADALDEARRSARILIFAYVIMPDHTHIITDGSRSISEVLRYMNGISAKRVIDYLKENNYETSLGKLRQEQKERGYKHSVWQHHPDAFRLTAEETFMQKVNYIHQNPVRAGLSGRAENYLYSSARIWRNAALENEPLEMDWKQIAWRAAAQPQD
ncbi:MAG TPA: transposase [Pyrinomonadaceae bacterium]|jgi:REP element-mobilizing transposase RayT|nr:transposase [Pyrinomonadaceae bacterium]